MFSVHPEPFTVVARADSGIESFDDLKGKRVNVGNPGSGQRSTMEVLMDAKGWTMDDFALASELKSAEQAQALCDNKIDAMVFTVGHPSGSIQEATTTCDTKLIPVSGPEVDQLVEENPYYAKAVIPGGMYAGTDEDVETFGVKATFVVVRRGARRGGLPGDQGGVRELRGLQEAAPRLRRPARRRTWSPRRCPRRSIPAPRSTTRKPA